MPPPIKPSSQLSTPTTRDLQLQITALKTIVETQAALIATMEARLTDLEKPVNIQPAQQVLGPPKDPLFNSLEAAKILQERKEHKKDSTVVLVGCKVPASELLSNIKDIIEQSGTSSEGLEEAFYHTGKAGFPTSIVKIRLHSHLSSNYHLLYRRILGKSDICYYSRSDLTRQELIWDRELRQQCKALNVACSLKKYIVSELRIVEISNPSPYIPHPTQKPVVLPGQSLNKIGSNDQ